MTTTRPPLPAFSAVAAASALFLALHLPYLPTSLEDVDSINFALGMRQFDVARHQPHPPGYPLFIVAANATRAFASSEPRALAVVSAVSAALGLIAMFALFHRLVPTRAAAVGVLVAATTPLYWFTAARPLSDTMGLSAAIAVQAAVIGAASTRGFIAAAFLSGVAAGIRSQVLWLTVPLLLFVGWRRHRGAAAASVAALVAGVLVWFVPLVAMSGGPAAYWHALFDQGAEDLSGIKMLWTSPTPRTLLEALYFAFVAPWAVWPLAAAVLVFAAAGVVVLWRHNRTALAVLAVAFVPYFAFDIVFQETFTVRYALPVIVPLALVAAVAISRIPQPLAIPAMLPIVMYGAHIGGRSIAAYSREAAPAFRLLADMQKAAATSPTPVLAPDRRQSFDLRRPIVWLGPAAPPFERQLTAPPQHEWLEAVKYWNGGGRSPVWFVVDPRRSAIQLVQHGDPIRYEWSVPFPVLMSGTRPSDSAWYRVDRPEWFVAEGWSLTPEAAGVSEADGRGLRRGSIEGGVLTSALSGATIVLGGRNFEPATRTTVSIAVGDLWRDSVDVAPGAFLAVKRLPVYQLTDAAPDYLPVSVTANPPVNVAIEQFDVASRRRPTLGFGDGWHEHELNGATGVQWRWLSEKASLTYVAPAAAVLRITGESPLKYYPQASRLIVRTGSSVLHDARVADDFTIEVSVPPALLPSTLSVETDQVHVPAERSWRGSADRRHLGLRIYSCELRPATVSGPGTAANSLPAR